MSEITNKITELENMGENLPEIRSAIHKIVDILSDLNDKCEDLEKTKADDSKGIYVY